MLRTPLVLTLAGLLASLLLGSRAASAQTTADAYTAGMRWSDGALPSQPWIPRRIAFAGRGQAVWAGHAVGLPSAVLYTGTDAASLSAALELPLAGAIGAVEVAAGAGFDELFSGAQFTGAVSRTSEVSRISALASSPVLWTRSLAPEVAGGLRIATGGGRLFAARFDALGSRVWLDRLDPSDGHSLFAIETPALGLRGLTVSADGARIALALGNRLAVFDAGGTSLFSAAISTSSEAFAMSADGTTLAMGDMGQVNLWRDTGAGFAPAGAVSVGGDWLATRAALSNDGWTLGIGWWNAKTGASIRFQMWDLAASLIKQDILQSGIYNGLQNFPEAVALSPDGQRMAIGTWGSGGPDPQLMLFDRDLAAPVYSTYLSGSVMALALDDTGTRIAVASKAGHANQFSTTGFVQLFDTGERDLQLASNVQTGAPFQLTSRSPGSTLSLFIFGTPLDPPAPLAGLLGLARVDSTAPFTILAAPADLTGRADLTGLVPADPTLVGFELATQALFAGPFGLEFSSAAPILTVL